MSLDLKPGWSARPAVMSAFFVAIFALLCALRLPLPDRPIRDVDEAVAALIATSWLEGGVPYRDAIDQRGPVTYAIYAATFVIAGKNNMLAVHWSLLLLIFAGCWLLFRFGAELGGNLPAGYLAAFLLAISSFTYRRSQMLAFHTEWPVLILSTLGMGLLWRALVRGETGWRLPLAGVAFGFAFLSKQPAIFDGMAAGLFLFAWQWREQRLLSRETVGLAVGLAGGFFAALGLCVAYFAAHGALGDFYLYFWQYNVEHYTAVVPLAERLRNLNPFLLRRHYLTANPLLLAAAAFATLRAVFGYVMRGRAAVDARLLLVLWFLGAYFGASYSGRNFGHYFIQLLAPACLIAALLVREAWRYAAIYLRILLLAAVVVGLALPLYRFRSDAALLTWSTPVPAKPEQAALLAHLAATTRPEDRIFVWGYNPEIYVLSHRRPATRYSNTNYLTGMLPWENHQPEVDTSEHVVPGAWDVLFAELEATPPAVVIDSSIGDHRYYRKYPITKFPRLESYLTEQYTLETTIPDEDGRSYYTIYRR